MTPEQEFKVAFLKVCAAKGLTLAQTHTLVKSALEKPAFISTALETGKNLLTSGGDLLKNLISEAGIYGVGAAIAAPPTIGYIAGDTLARMQDVDDVDVAEMRQDNLIAEYRRLARALKSKKREMIQ